MERLKKLDRLVLAITSKLQFLPALLTRLSVGIVFVGSGWGKLHNIAKVTEFFAELGIPMPELNARLVAGTEFVCGGLLVLGLATRFAAIPLMITMVVALLTAKSKDIGRLDDLFSIYEYLYILLLIWLAVFGAGGLSMDRLISKRRQAK
jgi:putative oxidoreductase